MKVIFGSFSHEENLTNNKENTKDSLCFEHHKKNHQCVVILTNENIFFFLVLLNNIKILVKNTSLAPPNLTIKLSIKLPKLRVKTLSWA
jgi:hypothetical protein